jgi:hypothetical protein
MSAGPDTEGTDVLGALVGLAILIGVAMLLGKLLWEFGRWLFL